MLTATEAGRRDAFFIDGEWAAPAGRRLFDVVSPSDESLFLRAALADVSDVERAVAAARQAFDQGPWPRLTPAERGAFLRRIGAGLRERAPQLAQAWIRQTGALKSLSDPLTPLFAQIFDDFATLGEGFDWVSRRPTQSGAAAGYLVREPAGVAAAIIPWNAPLMLAALKVAPALLAGCTVILKAAPEAPEEAYILAEVAAAAGLPAGVLNVLTADREESEALVRHPGVDKVSFTGSSAAGRKIASICGSRVARCTLELGGKSPAIILDDCDVEAAAQALAPVVQMMSGQTCAALTRIIVSRTKERALLEALEATLTSLRVGDPQADDTQVGPVSMQRQRDRVLQYIERGCAEGARLVTGGGRPAHLDRGFYVAPTLFAGVDNQSTIAREEIFGPVLSVIAVGSEEEAIDVANDTDFGLNASVFTQDPDRAFAVARRIRAGTVSQNAYRTDFNIAFGGFKQSGLGREGGPEGLLSYLETKTILLDAEPKEPKP